MRSQRVAILRAVRNQAIQPGRAGALALSGLLLALFFAACGSSTPTLPSTPAGTYSSAAFHFSVAYPAGWAPNEIQAPLGSPQATSTTDAVIPLTVVITQTGATDDESALLSTFTVTVLNANNPTIAQSIKAQQTQASGANPTLKTITLAGQQAWQAASVSKPLQGSDRSSTHTDYYLLHGPYEFQLSTDAIAGGGADAALAAMLKSFTFTA